MSSTAAMGSDTFTGVVVVVVAGTFFFRGVSPTVARRIDFRFGVCGSDLLSLTHCSVGVAVVVTVEAVVVGTVTVSLWTTCGFVAWQAVKPVHLLPCWRRHCLPCQMIRRNLMCTEIRI